MNTRSFLLSAVIAGGLLGLFSNLPLLNFVNCVLCVWVWLGGILAVFLYRRFASDNPDLTVAQGAGLGALSGLFGTLAGAVVFLVTGALSMPLIESMASGLQVEGDLPFQTGGGFGGVFTAAMLFMALNLVLYPIFGAVGGVIGAGLLWKKPQEVYP